MSTVFLLRASISDPGSAEATAHLTLEGRRLVRAIATKVHLDDAPSFDRVITSPWPASVQTAELFAERVDYVGSVEVHPGLAGAIPPNVLAKDLFASGNVVLVVADEPHLSALGAYLVGRPTFPPGKHAQLSVVRDGEALYCLRPGEPTRSLLLLA